MTQQREDKLRDQLQAAKDAYGVEWWSTALGEALDAVRDSRLSVTKLNRVVMNQQKTIRTLKGEM